MIILRDVSKSYSNGFLAVDRLNLDVDEGEFCVLVGPSGCGKTTTLKMLNRLIEPTAGEIFIGGENILDIDPVHLRRHIGYVMQHGGLFPHKRVAENVGVVPKLLGWSKPRTRERVRELLELVGLDPTRYERRFPHELSGGERQRVGVARALGGDPPVLLMDEPFGAVDPITRKRLQEEFKDLQKTLKKTVIFVTHDIAEAVTLGTTIAVLRKGGVLEQFGSPKDVLGHPATRFVAEFVGGDGGLEQLGITQVELGDLTRVPAVAETVEVGQAEQLMDDSRAGFAVVIDGSQRPIGWAPRRASSIADGERRSIAAIGTTALPIEATISIGTSLKDALAVILSHDEGFVAVLDQDRYVGVLSLEDLHVALRRSTGEGPSGS